MNTMTTQCQWWKDLHKRKWRPTRTYCRVRSWEGRDFDLWMENWLLGASAEICLSQGRFWLTLKAPTVLFNC